MPVWADGPDSEHLDDDVAPGFAALRDGDGAFADISAGDEAPIDPSADAELADWLALARETAERASAADSRSRGALYQAVGKAWDFALAAEEQPDAFAALLDDAGLAVQDRAPMTPVVKLVFGAAYDKTRLAEYACVLGHAKEEGLRRGALAGYLDRYPGGLKGLVKDARARSGRRIRRHPHHVRGSARDARRPYRYRRQGRRRSDAGRETGEEGDRDHSRRLIAFTQQTISKLKYFYAGPRTRP